MCWCLLTQNTCIATSIFHQTATEQARKKNRADKLCAKFYVIVFFLGSLLILQTEFRSLPFHLFATRTSFFFSEYSLWQISFYCRFNATTRRRTFVLFCCYLFFFMKIIILIAWYMVRKWDQAIKKNNDKFYLAFFFFHCEKWAQFLVIFHNFVTISSQLINLNRKKWHNRS